MGDIMIRKYVSSDLNRIMELWLQTNVKAHDFVSASYWEGMYDIVKMILPDATITVYEEDGKILGFVGKMNEYIAGLFVDYDFHSQGIGTALIDNLKEKNPYLTLHVYEKNQETVDFYLKQGFKVISKEVQDHTNEVELYMKWDRTESLKH